MVFGVSATLTRRIHADLLQQALDRIMPRFPYYKVQLRSGLFWHFLEENAARVLVRPENPSPCMVLPDRDGNKLLFRVQAFERRISVEFSHIITDGAGALLFFKTLIAAYLELRGSTLDSWEGLLNPDDEPDPEEYEDAYSRYTKQPAPKPERMSRAFRLPFPLRLNYRYSVLTGECSSRAVYTLAKELGVSVTEYLAGIYLYILQGIYKDLPGYIRHRARKTLRLNIPVDLRKLYPTKTMRNFTLLVSPGVDLRLGWYSFDEIVQQVHFHMRSEAHVRHINRQLVRNLNPEVNAFFRGVPLLLKNAVLHSRYANLGPIHYSGVLTNIGVIDMPGGVAGEIESFTFIPTPGPELRVHAAVATYGDRMRITFGSVTEVQEVEQRFFGFLVDLGIHVKLFRCEDV